MIKILYILIGALLFLYKFNAIYSIQIILKAINNSVQIIILRR